MSYDPSGTGLFPEAPLDERDEPTNWRRHAGTAGASLGDLVAADPKRHVFMSGRMAFGPQSIYRTEVCVTCGRSRKEHLAMSRPLRVACESCGRTVATFVPRHGDGSARRVVAHYLEKMPQNSTSAYRASRRCPGRWAKGWEVGRRTR